MRIKFKSIIGPDEQTQPKFRRIPKVGKGSGVLDERGVSYIIAFTHTSLSFRVVV